MAKYIFRRLLLLFPVLFGVSLATFVVMHSFTADPAEIILGQHATTDKIAALREELGLNKPMYVQFWDYISKTAGGDLGESVITKTSITEELLKRFPATVELAFAAIVIASVLGIVLGVISAVKQNSILDYGTMVAALLGVSMPIFWLGLMMIILFSVTLGWLPASGRISIGLQPEDITGFYILDSIITGNMESLKDALQHMVMPAVALGSYSTAIIARMTRAAMLETIRQDYIRTARAKGLRERVVIVKHALRNALIPIVTVIGLQLGSLLGGAVLTETVFSWPGIGSYVVEGILVSDYPRVQGVVLLIGAIFVVVNLIVDVLYCYLDPRIQHS
ncbi:MAG TPA: ABC transporter permease [Methylomusa anaerophila]|uniref:Dipeptide transport system permease protein DppB n=1 Tax=Methylomusa anaerophila TaxID=1930071 RepID=A0A348AIB5_9FIRM|nr:ABC transporter permease [Methylomusa anaerophila]BBB90813.1 dipeptide transport system permease protein DppB [Methylomusa anaerophila]HML90530.1 ABC transporter permease [Methylomusa anaerophila]